MTLAPTNRLLLTAILGAPALIAATPQQPAKKAASPVTLVSRAEKLIQKGDKEDGALMLWQALDLLRGKASNAVEEATLLSARYLLKENDPLEMERRAVYTAVATAQTELAKSYRIKKWYDTAQTRLDVAAQFDPEVIGKESSILASKRKGAARTNKSRTKPSEAAKPKAAAASPLMRNNAVKFASGDWLETPEGLTINGHKPPSQHREWICAATHEENEVSIEVRPDDPNVSWNLAVCVGLGILPGQGHYSGYRCHVHYLPKDKTFQIYLWNIVGMEVKKLAKREVKFVKTVDGYHRIAFRVSDTQLEGQVDGLPPLTLPITEKIRGHIGIIHGTTEPSCALHMRNLRIAPLPVDEPSDEELRKQASEAQQHQVTKAVEEAKDLLSKRKHEAAAQRLRDALAQLQELPEGILRTNLQKSITTMLKKSDKLAKKRERAATTCATAFGDLADKYVLGGQPRLALRLVHQAMRFDPLGQSKRLAVVEKAVDDWNVKQLTTNAAALAPPKDDGAQLRQWFEQNRLLDSRSAPWVAAGASVRTNQPTGRSSVLMPQKQTMLAGSVAVHMHLPVGCQGGIAFDAAGPHDYSIAFLGRSKTKLTLTIARWAGGKWIYLGNSTVPLDRWRLEGWHQMHLELAATGIKVKVGDSELKVKRERLGLANGRIGLYAGGNAGADTVEFRALEAKPK